MKRLLLAPLFLTLLLSSCKGQQICKEKYMSELDLAVEQMELITNMVEDYKQRGIMLKNQNSPISAKAMIQRAIDLIYKAEDLKDYSVCLNEKLTDFNNKHTYFYHKNTEQLLSGTFHGQSKSFNYNQ